MVRDSPGEVQLAAWAGGQDLYVVGAAAGQPAVWHLSAAAPSFQNETVTPLPAPGGLTQLSAVWGSGPDDVYAVGDGGVVLRRDAGTWGVDRPPAPAPAPMVDQPVLRGLWGSAPGAVLAVGPAGIVQRTDEGPGPTWSDAFGSALTGADLNGAAVLPSGEGYLVGTGGVLFHQPAHPAGQSPAWQREAAGVTSAALHAVAIAADGAVYAAGAGGTVLRRSSAGWTVDRAGSGAAEPALLALAVVSSGISSDEVFAVGESGRILRRAGGAWLAEAPPAVAGAPLAANLRAAAALPDGSLLLGGDLDTVLLRAPQTGAAGAAYQLLRYQPGTPLSWTGLVTVPATGGAEVWGGAQGAGYLLHLRAGALTLEPSPLAQATAIAGTAPDDLYLCDGAGNLMRFDGVAWTAQSVPLGEPLRALAIAGEAALAAGDLGFLIAR